MGALEMLKLLGYAGKQFLLLSLKENILCGGAIPLDNNQSMLSQGAFANRDGILRGR
jgi:hypothetical protein